MHLAIPESVGERICRKDGFVGRSAPQGALQTILSGFVINVEDGTLNATLLLSQSAIEGRFSRLRAKEGRYVARLLVRDVLDAGQTVAPRFGNISAVEGRRN